MKRVQRSLILLAAILCMSFLLLPVAALLFHVSWDTLWQSWRSDGTDPLGVSLVSTAASMVVIALFGTPLAWLLARGRSRLWRVLEFLMMVPLLMPPLVIGLLLIYCYGPNEPIGQFLAHLHLSASNTLLAIVIAQVYEAIPYYILSAESAFRQVPRAFEYTSYTLGVSPFVTFWRITFPLAMPGLAVGLTMAFARAIGAFGAVMVVAYNPHSLPISIWVALEEQGLPAALPMALLLLAAALPFPLAAVLWRRFAHAENAA